MRPSHTPAPPDPETRLRTPWASRLAAGLILLVLAGCVKNFPNPFDRSGGASSQSVELFVDNQNFNEVRLYKTGPEGRQSVGVVTGRSSQSFTVPWRQTAGLRFQIEVLAGRTYQTNQVTASPGDRLQLYIRDNPNNTYLTLR